jgi:hypothetical protein
VAGLVLLIALFLPWYWSNGESWSGWASFALIDKLILLTALLAIALPIVAMLKPTPAGPQKLALVTLAFALFTLLCAVVRLFDPAEFDGVSTPVDLRFGAFLVVAALIGVAACTVQAMRERRAHRVAPSRVATSP